MIRKHVLRGLAATALVLLASSSPGAPPSVTTFIPPVAPFSPTAAARFTAVKKPGTLRTPQVLQRLNQKSSFEGYYYDGTVPMLIDDLTRLQVNAILPEAAYVPLTGAIPAGVKNGDKIRIDATLRKPTTLERKVAKEVAVANITAGTTYTTLSPSTLAALTPARIVVKPPLRFIPTKWAVLISGGANYTYNYPRYWTDTLRMYALLVANGYAPDHIKVYFADGNGRTADMPVNGVANLANLQAAFSDVGSKMSPVDTLYVMVTDHGGGYLYDKDPSTGVWQSEWRGGVADTSNDEDPIALSNGTTVMADETINLWQSTMTDDDFKDLLGRVPSYGRMIVQLNQCFSGGVLRDIAGPKRIVMSAASKTEFSWASDSNGNYEEFIDKYMLALETKPASADKNHDGFISIVEAYEYARANDSQPEVPYYDDDGIYPPHAGPMPGGGEGALGAETYL